MKQRIEFIDLAKGICISLVVLLHVFGDLSGPFIQVMNLFRMPLYFVLSGLFFKTYDGLLPFLKKKTNRLLMPFLFSFVVVILPSTLLLNMKTGTETTWTSLLLAEHGKLNLGINGASWFLLCLFFVNLYFYLIFLLTKRRMAGITLLACACGLSGYLLSRTDTHLPLWLDSSLTAMPFFLVGYAMRNYGNILYGKLSVRHGLVFGASLLSLLAVFWADRRQGTGIIVFGDNCFDISIVSLYLGGIAGTVCVLLLAKLLVRLPGLSYIGRYSIVVLLTHLLFLFAFRNVLFQLHIPQDGLIVNLLVFLAVMLLSLPTIWLCIRYLPWFFAQKDLWR